MALGTESPAQVAQRRIMTVDGLDTLIAVLERGGYRVVGPTLRDGGHRLR